MPVIFISKEWDTMKRRLLIQMADPSGNKTAFVLSGARQEDYQGIAKYIMEETDYGAEQVGFVKSTNAFDMSGMEFCGNAARAFALISAKGLIDGKASEEKRISLEVTVSGMSKPVICGVDTESDHASASIPLPKRVRTLKHCEYKPAEGKTVVVMEGIVHLIADGLEYDDEDFDQIRQALIDQFDPAALGVMYINTDTLEMTPVVHVRSVGSTFTEGSCGSGSAAAAYCLATRLIGENAVSAEDNTDGEASALQDGTYEYEIKQPAGTVHASCVIDRGEPRATFIEGQVILSDPEFITVEYESNEDEISAMTNTW